MTPQPTPPALRALEAAYRTERGKLIRYLKRSVGNDLAADLVQEVFARAARTERFDEVECPAAYLRTAARNALVNHLRRAKSKAVKFVPLDEVHEPTTPPNQLSEFEAGEVMAACQRGIDAMSPKTRQVFLMSRIEQACYREIADRLGIGEKGVEYHLRRALSLCRRAVAVRR